MRPNLLPRAGEREVPIYAVPFSYKCLFVTSVIAFSGQATTHSPQA